MGDTASLRREYMLQRQTKRVEEYRRLNKFARKGQVVLAGSSLMEFFPANELLQDRGSTLCVYNRGIAGYVSSQLLANLGVLVLDLEPSKLFINIGTNDIGGGIADELWVNYPRIISTVQERLPECRIHVMAYYPCNELDDFGIPSEEKPVRFAHRNRDGLRRANERLERMAQDLGCKFVNVNAGLADERGVLPHDWCQDGIHLWPEAYEVVLRNLLPYLED